MTGDRSPARARTSKRALACLTATVLLALAGEGPHARGRREGRRRQSGRGQNRRDVQQMGPGAGRRLLRASARDEDDRGGQLRRVHRQGQPGHEGVDQTRARPIKVWVTDSSGYPVSGIKPKKIDGRGQATFNLSKVPSALRLSYFVDAGDSLNDLFWYQSRVPFRR
jgi:hypothetical protein